jgi:uncharacterized membrane protein YvbJ
VLWEKYMFCKYCGAQIDDDSLFCSKCGAKTHILKENKTEESTDTVQNNKTEEHFENAIEIDNKDTVSKVEKNNKALKKIIISFFIVIIVIVGVVPVINHLINASINKELDSIAESDSYLIQDIELDDSGQITIRYADSLDWDRLENKKIQAYVYIMESGAVCDTDNNGIYYLAKGYSGYVPGWAYTAGSKQERAKDFGDDGFYNLCIASASSEVFNKSISYDFNYDGEPVKLDENRIYNFFVELDNTNSNRVFYNDSYFRYNDGGFVQVKTGDLKPEDTYFLWKDNELHFARFSGYSNDTPPQPYFDFSDETYDSRN